MPPKREGKSGSQSRGMRHGEERPPEGCKHSESKEDEGQREDRELIVGPEALAAQAYTDIFGPLEKDLYLLTARLPNVRKIESDDEFERIYENKKETLGAGCFGTVIRYTHKDTGKSYAIKQIHKYDVFNEYPQQTYKRGIFLEAACWTHILPEHQNVVKVDRIYESPDRIHIVMELLGSDMLTSQTSYNPDEVCTIFRKFLEGVKHLHEHGIVHCDLSERNICMRDDKLLEPVIIDLGIASPMLLSKEIENELMMFKLLSPEERRHACTIGKDMLALGRILGWMLKDRSDRSLGFKDGTPHEAKDLLKGGTPHEANDLLKRLSSPHALENSTVAELLEHPWFKPAGSGASS